MAAFTIYPAIDLRNGEVVRLRQGNPNEQKIYSKDASQIAEDWISAGAEWLHIVNLDAAFGNSADANWFAINEVVQTCKGRAAIQLGGGIRDIFTIRKVLAAGISRIILGTAAIENKEFASRALEIFGPDQISFSLDAKKGELMTRGWTIGSGQTIIPYANHLAALGAKTLIYTKIETDGMGTGNDYKTAQHIAKTTSSQVIASGGVASIEDVENVKAVGLSGLIIGRALYENQIRLEDALAC